MAAFDPPEFRMLPDDEVEIEQDEPGPARSLGRRGKFAIGVVVAVLAVSGLLVQTHRRDSSPHPIAAPVPTLGPHWPVGLDNCGESVPQPVVQRTLPASPTGSSVYVGGLSLIVADLDSGTFAPVPGINLPDNSSFIDGTLVGPDHFVEIADCRSGARIVHLDSTGRATTVLTDPVGSTLLSDGVGGTWAARFSSGGTTIGEAKLQVTMHRLDKPDEIPLGALMYPLALHGHTAYVRLESPGAPDRLQSYDLLSHRVVHDFGPVQSVTMTAGQLLWLPRVCSSAKDCRLDSLDAATGQVAEAQFDLPTDFTLDHTALSPDGRLLAVQSASEPPSDSDRTTRLMVLDRATGVVRAVPNLLIPPGARIDFTFSPDSTRLVLAVGAGAFTDFYTWKSGQTALMDSPVKLPGAPPSYLEPASTS